MQLRDQKVFLVLGVLPPLLVFGGWYGKEIMGRLKGIRPMLPLQLALFAGASAYNVVVPEGEWKKEAEGQGQQGVNHDFF